MKLANVEVEQEVYQVAITGTHSSGKSTLLNSFEMGKIQEIGVFDSDYDDFGFGLLNSDSDQAVPVITVPEAATYYADLSNRPALLSTEYNIHVQSSVEVEHLFRTVDAYRLMPDVVNHMLIHGLINAINAKSVMLIDRGPLDGLVYSEVRLGPEQDIGLYILGKNRSRTDFFRTILHKDVDMVLIAEHSEIPFEPSEYRAESEIMRNSVATKIEKKYQSEMSDNRVHIVRGSVDERHYQASELIQNHIELFTPVAE
jgi:nicotinamide riboside kinase